MRSLSIFCALVLLLTACAGVGVNLDAPVGSNPLVIQASPTLQETSLQALEPLATSPPTLTPTKASTPTTDYPAKIGAAELELQLSLGTATMAAVTEVAIIKTSTVLQSHRDKTASATVAAGQGTASATAAIGQTQEAHAVETESWEATATVQAPITQRLQVEADWAPVWQGLIVLFVVLLGLLTFWYLSHIFYQCVMLVYERRLAERPAPPPPAARPLEAKLDNRDEYGWGAVDFTTLPIDEKTLRDVAELLTCGVRYTQAQMTGRGRPLVKDGSFNTFGDWMDKFGIAIKADGRYTIQHLEFFEQVLMQR